ncbi:MAG: hypothetical protein COA58_14120 [Bacteroidetes bacterium]|nr:MAG: hypothetical protein COA58_14120 [Bacteroidota bacterium]
MKQFMYLFRGGPTEPSSPEQMEAVMDKWKTWMGGLAAKGLLNGGEPLQNEGVQVTNGGNTITDGPFTEGKEIVGGYLSINAKDMDEAVELSKECPQLDFPDGQIEVREIMKM